MSIRSGNPYALRQEAARMIVAGHRALSEHTDEILGTDRAGHSHWPAFA